MDAITGLLASLGINSTTWIQLGVFLAAFVILYPTVFKPYFAAFLEREKQTRGDQIEAEKLLAQSRELEVVYQRKARNINADIKAIYDKFRSEATREQEKVLSEAREKAKATADSAREKIQVEIGRARVDLEKEIPAIGQTIVSQLVSKGL